jgi:ATP-dependent RNA helicase RhlE
VSFNRFGFLPEVVRGTQAMGFVEPTAIQLRAFPIVLAGKDLIGTAQTGTGKTAAFALPILTLLAKHAGLRCLVLEPTRELAAQVETAFRDYGRFTAKNSSAASIFSSPHLDACSIFWSSVR